MAHSSENPTILLTPVPHNMNLRPRTPVNYTYKSNAADRSTMTDFGSCGGLLTGRASLRTVNSALSDFGANAARKLRTVKRAWGNFKSKLKPRTRASKRQRLWTVTAVPLVTSPTNPSTGRYRAINSPLSPSIYQTPNSRLSSFYQTPPSLSYRELIASTPDTPDTLTFGTPDTDMTPLNLTMMSVTSNGSRRRSQRIMSSTPQLTGTAKKRITPKRGKKATPSPGRFLQDMSNVTRQMSTLAQNMQAFQSMEKGFTKTIEKQDSNSTLTELTIPSSSEGKEEKCLGVRASKRISKTRLKQLEENMQTDSDDGDKTPKAAVGLAYDVEQDRLV